jgi:hypothetical protein
VRFDDEGWRLWELPPNFQEGDSMKLYRVKIEVFGPYYVLATSTDAAIKKLKTHLAKTMTMKSGERKIAGYEVERVELVAGKDELIV